MHGSGPKLLIIAKKEVLSDEMPDFSGDSYLDAKKKMIEGGEEGGADTDKYPDDHHAAMKMMAEELYKASKMHGGQADKLMEICQELYEKGEANSDSDKKPHKSYGDHNPYGHKKEY
jgi:DNA-binding ferritin-like protein (Dps family)